MRLVRATWVHHGGGSINSVDVQPGSTRFATGGEDGKVKWWMTAPFSAPALLALPSVTAPLYVGTHHEGAVKVVRWAGHGQWLASGADDHCVLIWQQKATNGTIGGNLTADAVYAEHWTPICILKGHGLEIQDVAWCPGDRYLASSSFDNTIRIWALDFIQEEGTMAAGLVPDSAKRVRLDAEDGVASIHSAAKQASSLQRLRGTVTCVLDRHTSWSQGLSWDPFGKLLASFGDDKKVCVWAPSITETPSAGSKRVHSQMGNASSTLYKDMNCVAEITDVFSDVPGSNAFNRIDWSPDGCCFAACNGIELQSTISAEEEEHGTKPLWTTPIFSRSTLSPSLFLTGQLRASIVSRYSPTMLVSENESHESLVHCLLAAGTKDGSLSIWMAPDISRTPLAVLDCLCTAPISDITWGAMAPALGPGGPGASTCLSEHKPCVFVSSLDGTLQCCILDDTTDGIVAPIGTYAPIDMVVRSICASHSISQKAVDDSLEELLQASKRQLRNAPEASSPLQQRMGVMTAAANARAGESPTPVSISKNRFSALSKALGISASDNDRTWHPSSAPNTGNQPTASPLLNKLYVKRYASSVSATDVALWVLHFACHHSMATSASGERWTSLMKELKPFVIALPTGPSVLAGLYGNIAAGASLSSIDLAISCVHTVGDSMSAAEVEASQKVQRGKGGKRRIAPVLTTDRQTTPQHTATGLSSPAGAASSRVNLVSTETDVAVSSGVLDFGPSALDIVLAAHSTGAAPNNSANSVGISNVVMPVESSILTFAKAQCAKFASTRVVIPNNVISVDWQAPAAGALQQALNSDANRSFLYASIASFQGTSAGSTAIMPAAWGSMASEAFSALGALTSSISELAGMLRKQALPSTLSERSLNAAVAPFLSAALLNETPLTNSAHAANVQMLNPYQVEVGDAEYIFGSMLSECCSVASAYHVQRVSCAAAKWCYHTTAPVAVMLVSGSTSHAGLVVLGCSDGSVHMVDAKTGKLLCHVVALSATPVLALAAHANVSSTSLFVGCLAVDGALKVFSSSDFAWKCTLDVNVSSVIPSGSAATSLKVSEGGTPVIGVRTASAAGRFDRSYMFDSDLRSWVHQI